MPCYWWGCREKNIHSIGVVQEVKLVSKGNHPFTGIFKGADFGLVRHSTGRPYFSFSKASLAPALGLKFLRDGMDSANVMIAFSLDGNEDSWNYFKHDWSNQV